MFPRSASFRLIGTAFVAIATTGCDINNSHSGPGDAALDANDSVCITDAGPDVDPLQSCSPSGCIPFDNSVIPPNVPRL